MSDRPTIIPPGVDAPAIHRETNPEQAQAPARYSPEWFRVLRAGWHYRPGLSPCVCASCQEYYRRYT